MITVRQIFDMMKKREHWSLEVYDSTGNVTLGYCNDHYKWSDVNECVKELEVVEIAPHMSSISIFADIKMYRILSKEYAKENGWEEIYSSILGITYAKEENGRYIFAVLSDILGHKDTWEILE